MFAENVTPITKRTSICMNYIYTVLINYLIKLVLHYFKLQRLN